MKNVSTPSWDEIKQRIKDHKPYQCKFPKCKTKVLRPDTFCDYHDSRVFNFRKKHFGG